MVQDVGNVVAAVISPRRRETLSLGSCFAPDEEPSATSAATGSSSSRLSSARTCRRTRQALFAMEDIAAYEIKCKSLIFSSFVEDSQHSAVAKSTNAAIFSFENEGDRV